MTPRDLISLALKDAGVSGVGQTPSAEDMNDAFTRLNMMIGQWNRRRWLVYHLIDTYLVSTGASSYSIGPGGDFNVPRADRIESAFIKSQTQPQPWQVDTGLQVIQSREDYNRIALKGQPGFARAVFLDSDYPMGTVYVWPSPTAGSYQIHLTLKAAIAQFGNLSDTVNLPPEYSEALLYNLTVRLRAAYQLPPDPVVMGLATAALNTIRNSNAQIPLLRMPDALRRGNYDFYSDQVY